MEFDLIHELLIEMMGMFWMEMDVKAIASLVLVLTIGLNKFIS